MQNLRALADTGDIALKPITLLVGKNSVGKSTFARIFPLLRQSYEEKRRAPILWWGKYVDFGTFNDAVNRAASEKEISISFDITVQPERRSIYWYDDRWDDLYVTLRENTEAKLEIVFGAHEGQTHVKRTTIVAGGLSCCVTTSHDGRITEIMSGDLRWTPQSDVIAAASAGELLPIPRYTKISKTKDAAPAPRIFNPMAQKVIDAMSAFAHRNTANTTLTSIAARVPFLGTPEEVIEALAIGGSPKWKKGISELVPSDPRLQVLRRWLFINALPKLYRMINDEIRSLSLGVRYLEPLRATAQRFYRPQELAVDEIDSKGENLAVYIHSMDTSEKSRFNTWLREHLGFEVLAIRDGGHISLKVRFENEDSSTNLADTGFGMSQVLPIATQLWSSLSRRPRRDLENTSCFVVEQPELHLHPAFQEQIADLFVAAVGKQNRVRPFSIVAETHSSSLINRLGELVALGKISKSDIQVVMFEQVSVSAPVETRISAFDDEGVLQNWPFGFFSSGRTE